MRGRPWRIVAVQATLSMAAILIVYLTLLRADGGQPLYDVQAPGAIGGQQELPRPEPEQDRERRPDGTGSNSPRQAGTGPSGPAVATPELASEQPAEGGQTPTSDQYASTVSQIRTRLSASSE